MAKYIFIATSGSRGDVEPFIALGKALQNAGYDVVLSAPPDYGGWIASHGIAHHAVGEPVAESMHKFAEAIENDRFFQSVATEEYKRKFLDLFASIAAASEGADLLIYSTLQASLTCLSELRGTPIIGAHLQPAFLTGEFAVPVQPRYSFGRFFNHLSYRAVDFMMWTMFRSWWNDARRETLNLKPLGRFHNIRTVKGKPVPQLFAVSEAMVPRPRDWPGYVHMTGNWFLDGGEDWTPPPDLTAFLESGPPPIYIGFGSMPIAHMEKRTPVLLEALRLSGQRAVFARGWGGWGAELTALGQSVHVIDDAPHRHLFPLMAGVVHHGGAGTTAAGFRAGRPALITPLIMDQFFNGNLVARLGAGPQPLPVKRWRADVLAERLTQLTRVTSYGERAREISARMVQENGVARAVEAVRAVIGAP